MNSFSSNGEPLDEMDLELVHAFSFAIGAGNGASIYLLHAEYIDLVRVNLVLLKAFLEGQGETSYAVEGDILPMPSDEGDARRKYIEVPKMRRTNHLTGRQSVNVTRKGGVIVQESRF
jgi:KaiC/GvpD/RAD55 family RecA-like ATPase